MNDSEDTIFLLPQSSIIVPGHSQKTLIHFLGVEKVIFNFNKE